MPRLPPNRPPTPTVAPPGRSGEHLAHRAVQQLDRRRARRAPRPGSRASARSRARRARRRAASPGRPATGSGGSSPRSRPSRPGGDQRRPARGRGCSWRPQAFSSAFVDGSSDPRNGEATRTGASRLSSPQHTNAPAQKLRHDPVVGVEARRGQRAQARAGAASTPAMNDARLVRQPVRARERRRSGCASPSHSEKWTWQPLPALSGHGFGASDATSPCRAATPRIVSRTSSCSSAAWSAGACAGRDLLLAVAELGVVLLERDPLGVERRGQVVDVVLGRPSSPIVEKHRPAVDRLVRAVDRAGERELVLERRPACAGRARRAARSIRLRNERWQTAAGIPSSPIMSVSTTPVCGAYGSTRNVLGVGDEPHLADRPHARRPAGAGRASSSPASRRSGRCPLSSRPPRPWRARRLARGSCRRCRTRGSGRGGDRSAPLARRSARRSLPRPYGYHGGLREASAARADPMS